MCMCVTVIGNGARQATVRDKLYKLRILETFFRVDHYRLDSYRTEYYDGASKINYASSGEKNVRTIGRETTVSYP